MNERVKIPRHQTADLIELSGRPFQSRCPLYPQKRTLIVSVGMH